MGGSKLRGNVQQALEAQAQFKAYESKNDNISFVDPTVAAMKGALFLNYVSNVAKDTIGIVRDDLGLDAKKYAGAIGRGGSEREEMWALVNEVNNRYKQLMAWTWHVRGEENAWVRNLVEDVHEVMQKFAESAGLAMTVDKVTTLDFDIRKPVKDQSIRMDVVRNNMIANGNGALFDLVFGEYERSRIGEGQAIGFGESQPSLAERLRDKKTSAEIISMPEEAKQKQEEVSTAASPLGNTPVFADPNTPPPAPKGIPSGLPPMPKSLGIDVNNMPPIPVKAPASALGSVNNANAQTAMLSAQSAHPAPQKEGNVLDELHTLFNGGGNGLVHVEVKKDETRQDAPASPLGGSKGAEVLGELHALFKGGGNGLVHVDMVKEAGVSKLDEPATQQAPEAPKASGAVEPIVTHAVDSTSAVQNELKDALRQIKEGAAETQSEEVAPTALA